MVGVLSFKLTVVEVFTSYLKPKLLLHDFLLVTLYKKPKVEIPLSSRNE